MKRFLLAIFALFLFATTLSAQSDGFFSGYYDYENRIDGISNETFGQNNVPGPTAPTSIVPLGSGLIILMTAGAGYVMMKRRRTNNMKKFFTVISVLVIVLGLTQCKKKTEEIANTQNTVHIILNVDSDSKVNVNTGNGEVTFEAGDVIHVGYNGNYVGTLTHDGERFVGNLPISPVGSQYLYFYFLGNITPTVDGNKLTVDINNQKDGLPVLSYGASDDPFTGSGSYTAMLNNRCALVKFTTTTNVGGYIRMTGFVNRARFNLANNTWSSWQTGDSYIDLFKKSGTEWWAILLPQNATAVATSKAVGYKKRTGIVIPNINPNDYLTGGNAIDISMEAAPAMAFSTSDDNFIKFAPGNLQATTNNSWATWLWSFKDNQYDEDLNDINVGENYSLRTSTSHFGWGASGNGVTKPNYTVEDLAKYAQGATDITGTDYDWGKVVGDLDGYDNWRTLTSKEWEWIMGRNSNSSNITGIQCRFSSTVNGVENARYTMAQITIYV